MRAPHVSPRLAVAALVPTGAVGVGTPLLIGLQARRARREITDLADGATWPEAARGVRAGEGDPVRLVVLGDSSAVGLGADRPSDTAGVRLLSRLAADGHAATLDVLAVSGAGTADLDRQVTAALALGAEVVVISIGANDVTHRVPPRRAARQLGAGVERLRAAGVEVVVATAPDLGAVGALGRPLRWIAALASHRIARAQERACLAHGAVPVPVGRLLGPIFAREREMFSVDGFHPSSAGYAAMVEAIWPAVGAAARRTAAAVS